MPKAESPDRIHLGRMMRRPSEHHPHLVGGGSVGLKGHRAAVWMRTDGARVVLDRDGSHGGSQADLDIVGDGSAPDGLRAAGRARISGYLYEVDLVAKSPEYGSPCERQWELLCWRMDIGE